MKPNKLTLGVIACTLGVSMYAHQLHAENSLQVPNNGNSKDSQTHNLVFIDEHQKGWIVLHSLCLLIYITQRTPLPKVKRDTLLYHMNQF